MGTWALTREWALARETTVYPMNYRVECHQIWRFGPQTKYSVMCQLPIELNYRHIVYVWSTDKFTERGRAISGRSIEAYPPVFNFASFLDSEALSKAIYHSLGYK